MVILLFVQNDEVLLNAMKKAIAMRSPGGDREWSPLMNEQRQKGPESAFLSILGYICYERLSTRSPISFHRGAKHYQFHNSISTLPHLAGRYSLN